jgi:hypothetical protein
VGIGECRYSVIIIKRIGWKPKAWSDVAPMTSGGDSIAVNASGKLARIMVERFNRLELKNPSGHWAVMRATQNATLAAG